MVSFRKEAILVVIVLATAVLLRAAAFSFSDNLSIDRDAYRAIATNLSQGNGYRSSTVSEPTAYRPPLYPLVLAMLLKLGGDSTVIGGLQLLLSTATVFLTWKIGRQLGLKQVAWIAALLVAVDPLSVHSTSSIMTETLFTFLVMLLLYSILQSTSATPDTPVRAGLPSKLPMNRQVGIGVLFGLCALCRPTIWAFGAFAGAVWILKVLRSGNGLRKQVPWVMLLSTTVVISGWVVRNVTVLGRPILTTTHGGYTLLLGNNPVFYEEVVNRPWGTTWQAAPPQRSQKVWFANVKSIMNKELGVEASEIERDRWMYRRAFRNIADEPDLFVRACRLRLGRLWNIVPQGSARGTMSEPVVWVIGLFYSLAGLGMVVGLFRLERREWHRWFPLVLLILSFSSLHCFYWTNMRMRTPLIPVIALLATRGFFGRRPPASEQPSPSETTSAAST